MIFILIGIIATIILFFVLGIHPPGEDHYNPYFKFRPLCLVSIVALLIFTGLGTMKSVPTGHTGIVTTFGKVEDYTLEAGVHFINPISKVIKIDNRTQKRTISMSAFSSDIQEVAVLYTVNYSLDKTNAQNLYRTVGLNYYEIIIKPKIVADVKKIMAKYTAENLVSSRADIAMAIENSLSMDLAKYNIQVVATAIEDLDFTDAFTNAVEAKQVAEQNKLKAQTEAETEVIKAEADAKVKLIEAQATADANDLLTESLTADILQKLAIERWDGKLPTVLSDGSNILDLTGLN